MNAKLFKIETTIPGPPEPVTIFSAQLDNAAREKKLDSRREQLSKVFGLNGNIADHGDRIFISEKSKSLSLYQASDSFWYQDDDLFAREEKKFSEKLPDDTTARETAAAFLRKNKLLLPEAAFHSISHTTVCTAGPDVKPSQEYNTEVHVNFRYSLNKLPVFGPGAKTRVSLGSNNVNSGVYHFWREVKPVDKREVIKAELALEIHAKNFRFAQLKNDSDKVTIKKIELGYFAVSPTDIQNFLVPVYKISGVVSTAALPEYAFTHHVVAVKYAERDVKSMGFHIGNVATLVF